MTLHFEAIGWIKRWTNKNRKNCSVLAIQGAGGRGGIRTLGTGDPVQRFSNWRHGVYSVVLWYAFGFLSHLSAPLCLLRHGKSYPEWWIKWWIAAPVCFNYLLFDYPLVQQARTGGVL